MTFATASPRHSPAASQRPRPISSCRSTCSRFRRATTGPPASCRRGNADPRAIADAAALLAEANAPLVLLGGGAVDAGEPALRIAEAIDAVILTTISGKGIVPADHPLCLGARLSQDKIRDVLRRADVILAVGTEISETDLWETKITIPGKLIRIDIDPANLVRPHAAAMPILADAATALAALATARGTRQVAPSFASTILRARPSRQRVRRG